MYKDVSLSNVCKIFAKAARALIQAPVNQAGENEVRNLICNMSAFDASNDAAAYYVGEEGSFWNDWKDVCRLDCHDALNELKCAFIDYEFGVEIDDMSSEVDVGHTWITVEFDPSKTGDAWFSSQLESLIDYYVNPRRFSQSCRRANANTLATIIATMVSDWAHGIICRVHPRIDTKWQVRSVYEHAMQLFDYEVASRAPRLFVSSGVGTVHRYYAEFGRVGMSPDTRDFIPFSVVALKNALLRLIAITYSIQHHVKEADRSCFHSSCLLRMAILLFSIVFDVHLDEYHVRDIADRLTD